MEKLIKSELESSIYKIVEETEYGIINYCPNDEKLRSIRNSIMKNRNDFLTRLIELGKEYEIDGEIMEELEEIL